MDENNQYDARAVSRLLLDKAKAWWVASLILPLSVFVVGGVATLTGTGTNVAGLFVIALTTASYLCRMRSSTWRGRGDSLRRKLDFEDAYGWSVSRADMSDVLMTLVRRDREGLKSFTQDPYFASQQPAGARRALENVQESSWFSKHLARLAGHISLAAIAVLIGISLAAMILALGTLRDFDQLTNISRVVTSAVMLVFSLDQLSLTLRYYDFSTQAAQVERQSFEQLKAGQYDLIASLKLWQDYHVSRAMAPLIPTWLWLWKRADLNLIWGNYRK